jgi:hypothetical protein
LAIGTGTTEGLAIALGRDGDVFSPYTLAGFLGMSLWLIPIGLHLLGTVRPRAIA